MEPQSSRAKTPSLLADPDNTPLDSADDLMMVGTQGAMRPTLLRRWWLPAAALSVGLLLLLMLRHGEDAASPQKSLAPSFAVNADTAAPTLAVPTNNTAAIDPSLLQAHTNATPVIEASSQVEKMPPVTVTGYASAAAAEQKTHTVVAQQKERTQAQSVTHADSKAPSAEVNLLAALLTFVKQKKRAIFSSQDASSLHYDKDAQHFSECPAANTEAGMLCRQHICNANGKPDECAKASGGS